jgi:hypothetical protein
MASNNPYKAMKMKNLLVVCLALSAVCITGYAGNPKEQKKNLDCI